MQGCACGEGRGRVSVSKYLCKQSPLLRHMGKLLCFTCSEERSEAQHWTTELHSPLLQNMQPSKQCCSHTQGVFLSEWDSLGHKQDPKVKASTMSTSLRKA